MMHDATLALNCSWCLLHCTLFFHVPATGRRHLSAGQTGNRIFGCHPSAKLHRSLSRGAPFSSDRRRGLCGSTPCRWPCLRAGLTHRELPNPLVRCPFRPPEHRLAAVQCPAVRFQPANARREDSSKRLSFLRKCCQAHGIADDDPEKTGTVVREARRWAKLVGLGVRPRFAIVEHEHTAFRWHCINPKGRETGRAALAKQPAATKQYPMNARGREMVVGMFQVRACVHEIDWEPCSIIQKPRMRLHGAIAGHQCLCGSRTSSTSLRYINTVINL